MDYTLTTWKNATTDTIRLRFNMVRTPAILDDWLVDGQAEAGAGCLVQARTAHSRYVEPTVLDLTFRGWGGCIGNAVNLTFVTYAHLSDQLADLDNRTLLQGGSSCTAIVTPPAAATAGCRMLISIATSDTEMHGVADGSDDGLADTNDAEMEWNVRKY